MATYRPTNDIELFINGRSYKAFPLYVNILNNNCFTEIMFKENQL